MIGGVECVARPRTSGLNVTKYLLGRDGHLFLDNDSNSVQAQTSGQVSIDMFGMTRIKHSHAMAKRRARERGSQYLHIIAPNKETAFRHFLPDPDVYERYGKTPVKQYFSSFQDAHVCSFFSDDALLPSSVSPCPYERGDSHWTESGSLHYLKLAFQHFRLHAEFERLRCLSTVTEMTSSTGDLSKLAACPPEDVVRIRLAFRWQRVCFYSDIINEGYVQHSFCDRGTGRALVLHDSFAHRPLDFLSEIFAETLFVHCPDFLLDLEEAYRPDIIIKIQAERFFPHIPIERKSAAEWLAAIEEKKGSNGSTTKYLAALTRRSFATTAGSASIQF